MDDANVQLILKIAGGGAVAATVGCLIWKTLNKSSRKDYPKDTVIHHQIGRGPYAPSLTPFAIKLETYLRIAKIPYLNVHDRKPSKKGKYTWIEYNGEEIADSELCIVYLNKKLGIDVDKKFSSRERGVARAFQKMLEENTYWTLALDRWMYNSSVAKFMKIPSILMVFLRWKFNKTIYAVGMGRHTKEEVYHIMDTDLKALSHYLGTNKFLLGDVPCQADCAIFGFLAQLHWHSFGDPSGEYFKKYANLCDYCERMKEKFWPDWEECTTKGCTQEATK